MDIRKEWVGLQLHLVNIYLEFNRFEGFVSIESVVS